MSEVHTREPTSLDVVISKIHAKIAVDQGAGGDVAGHTRVRREAHGVAPHRFAERVNATKLVEIFGSEVWR